MSTASSIVVVGTILIFMFHQQQEFITKEMALDMIKAKFDIHRFGAEIEDPSFVFLKYNSSDSTGQHILVYQADPNSKKIGNMTWAFSYYNGENVREKLNNRFFWMVYASHSKSDADVYFVEAKSGEFVEFYHYRGFGY